MLITSFLGRELLVLRLEGAVEMVPVDSGHDTVEALLPRHPLRLSQAAFDLFRWYQGKFFLGAAGRGERVPNAVELMLLRLFLLPWYLLLD